MTKTKLEDFTALLKQQIDFVASRWGTHNALVLGLTWLADRTMGTRKSQNKIASVTDVGRRIIGGGILRLGQSGDLRDWEEEDTTEFLESLRTAKRGKSTLDGLQREAIAFLRYCQHEGEISADVPLPTLGNGYFPYTRRNLFLTEAELKRMCDDILVAHKEFGKLVVLFHAIPFYTGMRSGELLNRTFKDLELASGAGFLKIRFGKTPAAIRKIQLDRYLPDWVMRVLEEYNTERLTTFPKQRKKHNNTALFGHPSNQNAYTREEIIPLVIMLGRYYSGKRIDLHAHRHRFMTSGLLAMNTGQSSTYVKSLRPLNRHHHEYDCLDVAQKYQGCIKHAGHGHIATTFQSYCHCFGAILSLQQA